MRKLFLWFVVLAVLTLRVWGPRALRFYKIPIQTDNAAARAHRTPTTSVDDSIAVPVEKQTTADAATLSTKSASPKTKNTAQVPDKFIGKWVSLATLDKKERERSLLQGIEMETDDFVLANGTFKNTLKARNAPAIHVEGTYTFVGETVRMTPTQIEGQTVPPTTGDPLTLTKDGRVLLDSQGVPRFLRR